MSKRDQNKSNQVNENLLINRASIKNNQTYILGSLVIVLLVTFISYYPCINNDFTNWDDNKYITENQMLQHNKPLDYFVKDKFVVSNYHPLTMITYQLEYFFVKLNPKQYHIDNLVLHLFNVVLVFWFIFMLTGFWQSASFVALLFGIHPMHVESVAWISERKDVLYTLFYFTSLISYLYYIKLKADSRIYIYILTVLFFLLSLLSKGQAVTLPLILLLIDYFYNRKINWKSIVEKIPFFALSIVFGLVAMYAQKTNSRAMVHSDTFINSFFYASYGLMSYIFKFFLPIDLSCIYNYPKKVDGILPLIFYLAPLVVVGIFIWIYFKWRNNKSVVFGVLFFLLNIGPVLQFIRVGNSITSDRYTYIPYVGLFFIFGHLLNGINSKSDKLKMFSQNNFLGLNKKYVFTFIFLIALYSYASNNQCRVWKNSETLWNNVIENYPDVSTSYINLTSYYLNRSQKEKPEIARLYFEKSINYSKKAISLEPGNVGAFNNLGIAYYSLGKYEDAILCYKQAVSMNPKQISAWYGLAMSEIFIKRYDSALININQAIILSPFNPDYYFTRGNIYSYKLMNNEAISDYNKVVVYAPSNLDTYNNLANCYSQIEKFDSAIFWYNKYLQFHPEEWKGYVSRGIAYAGEKKYNEAIKDYDSGIKLFSNDPYPYFMRSKAYFELKNKDFALKDALQARKLGMNVPEDYLKKLEK